MRRLLALAALAGCTPYEPDLTAAPFLCGGDEGTCPKGYACVTDEDGMGVCQSGPIPPDAPVVCADDSTHEPNDTLATASTMPVDTMKTFTLDSLAICGGGDRDNFRVDIATTGENLEIVADLAPGGAILAAQILNAGGVPIADGSTRGTPVNAVRAFAANLTAGTYFVQVRGPDGGSNNYQLTFTITGP